MVKKFSLTAAVRVILSCFLASMSFATNEVRLQYAQFTPYYENGFDHAELEGSIEVKNLGPVKQVWLHYQNALGDWVDHPAFYTAPTTDNYEAFTFRLPLPGSVSSVRFAVKYRVNGQTYWDNNNQQDYRFDGNTQTAFKHQSVAVDDASRYYNKVTLSARSRYQSTGDKVALVYSVDHWQTQQRRELTLSHTVNGLYGSSGFWQTTLGIEYYRPFEYFLEYQTGNEVEQDDYHGKGYRLLAFNDSFGLGMFKQRYPQLYFRGQPTNWTSSPMSLIADYTWSILVYFDGSTDFKFDVYNDWLRNFGDNNADGFIDLNGNNLKVNTAGSIQITVNTQTGEYWIEPYY